MAVLLGCLPAGCLVLPCLNRSVFGAGKIHWKNTADQLKMVGPNSLGVALLTAGFVGMVFTIQVNRGWRVGMRIVCVTQDDRCIKSLGAEKGYLRRGIIVILMR